DARALPPLGRELRRVRVEHVVERALVRHAHDQLAARIALLAQPVGVDEVRRAVVGRGLNRVQQRRVVAADRVALALEAIDLRRPRDGGLGRRAEELRAVAAGRARAAVEALEQTARAPQLDEGRLHAGALEFHTLHVAGAGIEPAS